MARAVASDARIGRLIRSHWIHCGCDCAAREAALLHSNKSTAADLIGRCIH